MSTTASPTTPPSPPKSSSPIQSSNNTQSSPTTSVADKTSNTTTATATTNKRKRVSTTSDSSSTTHSSSASPRRRASTRPSPSQTPSSNVLPPPIIPYPTQQPLSVHPHLVPFYPVYPHHHHPVYISVSPSSTSPPFTATPAAAAPPLSQAPRSPAGDVPSPNGSGLATAAYYPAPPTTTLHTSPASRPSTADERELARKVSHSAIERRRRERINDKIVQLRQLIPSCADQEHLNKMTILQSAIDYITHLKHTVEKADERQKHQRKKDDADDDHDKETTSLLPPPSKIKSPQPMVPKEVAPFTSQFALDKSPKTPIATTPSDNDQQPLRGLKPMDIIDARKHGLGRTVNRSTTSSPPSETTSNTNMSVDAMLCGK